MKRLFLIFTFLSFVILLSSKLVTAQESSRPNIIVILTDDHGYADVGIHKINSDVKTPNIDKLASGGVLCTSGYKLLLKYNINTCIFFSRKLFTKFCM